MINRRRFNQMVMTGVMMTWAASMARAENYPSRPINLVLGEAAGGGTDFIARLVGQKLSERLGQPVVVENRPGASASIASDYVSRSAPDGYTIVEISGDHTTPPVGYTPNYDPVNSFEPIIRIGDIPLALVVNPSVPVNSLKEFIDYAKANPDKLNLGVSGLSTGHWASLLLKDQTGADLVSVQFKGGALAFTALLSNEVQVTFSPMSTSLAMVQEGKLKALAVTGGQRSPYLPSVPTFAEAAGLHTFDQIGMFYGILAPAGTPKEIVDKLHNEIKAILKSDDFKGVMSKRAFVVNDTDSTPEEFGQLIKDRIEFWKKLEPKLVSQ